LPRHSFCSHMTSHRLPARVSVGGSEMDAQGIGGLNTCAPARSRRTPRGRSPTRRSEMACSTGSWRTPCRINSQSAKLICRAAALDTRQLSRVITDFPSHASRPSRNAARPQTLTPAMRDPSPSSAGLPASSPRARKWKNGSPSLGRTGPNSCAVRRTDMLGSSRGCTEHDAN